MHTKTKMTADNFSYVNTNIQLALLLIFVQETIKNNMCIPKRRYLQKTIFTDFFGHLLFSLYIK
ncbi:hypothetical protein BGI23_22530 [Bacillus sp. ABP14]|nr:hypothetical protein BGI23_22530 [Bacillus sp. ABP14]